MASFTIGGAGPSLHRSIRGAIENSAGPCLVYQVYNPSRYAKCSLQELVRVRKCVCGNASAEVTRSGLHGAAYRLSLKSGGRAKGFPPYKQRKDVVLAEVKKTDVGEKDVESAEKDVQVDVEVVSWRERHITAHVCVKASYQIMWKILTDYERLAEFIPNLVRSERISSPHPGRIWILQQGVQSAMYWHMEVRVVLDLEELPHAAEIRFCMVDGDLKLYNGRWYLRPGPSSGTIMLHYEVNVAPKFFFPAAFVERIIRSDLPVNLRALVRRAETEPSEWQNIVELSKNSFEKSVPLALQVFRSDRTWGWRSALQMHRPFCVDEVHLRRLDNLVENGGGHRRVVATITVEAPVKDVWNVLTDYECLSEFIPNLAISKIISRESNRARLLQEGCKCILYMVLHARVVLDLLEKHENEILFQQVEGDFHSFQGKWSLEPLGSQHTLLKYVVDIKMHKHCVLAEAIVEEVTYVDLPANLCAIRDRVELRHRDPIGGSAPAANEAKVQSSPAESQPMTLMLPKVRGKRSRVVGLQKDFKVLERELLDFVREYGRHGHMPTKPELRQHKRVDLEKSIARMGGFSIVATRLNLCQERRPRGYWDNFQNLRREILLFQKESGMDSTYMPTRNALNKAGRHDVARALEKWGGVIEVARLMGLKARRVGLRSGANMSSHSSSRMDEDLAAQKPVKISLPAKPKKWVDMKELSSGDIS